MNICRYGVGVNKCDVFNDGSSFPPISSLRAYPVTLLRHKWAWTVKPPVSNIIRAETKKVNSCEMGRDKKCCCQINPLVRKKECKLSSNLCNVTLPSIHSYHGKVAPLEIIDRFSSV